MSPIELLNYIESEFTTRDNFIDLHIVNNTVVGFYKTFQVKYLHNKQETSYLFPTTFRFVNGIIETTMTLGSVTRGFKIPIDNYYGINFDTHLSTVSIANHMYKLLIAKQRIEKPIHNDSLIFMKAFQYIIYELDQVEFPFMRITS